MIEPGQIITSNYSQWMEISKQRNTLHSLLDVIWLQTKPIILQDLPRRNLLTAIIWQNLMRSIHEIFILCPNQTWDLLTTSIVQNKFPLTSKAEKVFFPLKVCFGFVGRCWLGFFCITDLFDVQKGRVCPEFKTYLSNLHQYNQNQYFKLEV